MTTESNTAASHVNEEGSGWGEGEEEETLRAYLEHFPVLPIEGIDDTGLEYPAK